MRLARTERCVAVNNEPTQFLSTSRALLWDRTRQMETRPVRRHLIGPSPISPFTGRLQKSRCAIWSLYSWMCFYVFIPQDQHSEWTSLAKGMPDQYKTPCWVSSYKVSCPKTQGSGSMLLPGVCQPARLPLFTSCPRKTHQRSWFCPCPVSCTNRLFKLRNLAYKDVYLKDGWWLVWTVPLKTCSLVYLKRLLVVHISYWVTFDAVVKSLNVWEFIENISHVLLYKSTSASAHLSAAHWRNYIWTHCFLMLYLLFCECRKILDAIIYSDFRAAKRELFGSKYLECCHQVHQPSVCSSWCWNFFFFLWVKKRIKLASLVIFWDAW